MLSGNVTPEQVLRQIAEDQADVRQLYLRSFSSEVRVFSSSIADAINAWRSWRDSGQPSEREYFCQTLCLTTISLQVSSMQLFLAGQLIASGNIQRQVLETIGLSYLCANEGLSIYKDFTKERYSSSKATRDLQRHGRSMAIEPAALQFLDEMTKHYGNFSHPSMLSLLTMLQGDMAGFYLGAAFDGGHLQIYELEAKWRAGLASKLTNIMQGVKHVLGVPPPNR